MSEDRSNRKTLLGLVASRSGDKTIKVNYQYTVPHPVYGKEVKRRTVLHAHDEKNECKPGDKVDVTVNTLTPIAITSIVDNATSSADTGASAS